MKYKRTLCATAFTLLSTVSMGHLGDTFEIKRAGSSIVPCTRKYLQYTETGDGLILFNAILTRTIEKVDYHGKAAWLIVQSYQTAKAIDRDSSYCELNSLRPLAYFTDIQSEQHREKVIFTETTIDNSVLFKDSSTQFTKANTGFYNVVMNDDLIAALPLKEKKQFILKTVNPGFRYFEYQTVVAVEGKELLSLPGLSNVWCWRLKISNGKSYTTEWYTVKGHQQVKKKFVFKNGNTFYRVATTL